MEKQKTNKFPLVKLFTVDGASCYLYDGRANMFLSLSETEKNLVCEYMASYGTSEGEPCPASFPSGAAAFIARLNGNGILLPGPLEARTPSGMRGESAGILEKYPSFVEPHIEIMRVFERYGSSNEALYDVVPVLFTRQGDRIILRSGNTVTDTELRRNENVTVFNQKAVEIKEQKQAFYGLRISSNSVTRLNPNLGKPLCINLPKVDESTMYTYTNPRTGIQYIYDTVNKIAFSHYTDDLDGDWILDDYGIRDWIEALPTKSISMATLANSYRIIGL